MVWGLGKGFGCSALGRLREGVVRFEVVVWVVHSSLVDGGGRRCLIVGGRLWSGDTDLVEVCG